ncbi:MAG TPA: ferredoxin reductase [Solirubrobacter sp.]|nr:ferredoxin reductase [Solirubrobacter sp.]
MSSATRATDWRPATVARIAPETPRAATLTLDVPGWRGHRAGQHVDVRLTAEDGYRAQRSYSISSAPGDGMPQITVVEADGGEVSGWMVSVAREDDTFEVRGPFGGWFVWDESVTEPVLLIGGGSGMVPLMSMLRAGARGRVLVSARDPDDLLFARELERLDTEVIPTYTRWAPRGWTGYARRVDRQMLREVDLPGARVYVCGPTPFVESVATDLVALGHDPATIRTERFG